MPNPVKPVPDGYHTANPYMTIKGAAKAIDFYKKAFGAKEIGRLPMPDGRIGHAEIQIGDSRIMMSDENPEWGGKSPETLGGTAMGFVLYVTNVDEFFAKAVAAGAKEVEPVKDQFYGDRSGRLQDPFGHKWFVATHIEDVSFDEMMERMKKLPPPNPNKK